MKLYVSEEVLKIYTFSRNQWATDRKSDSIKRHTNMLCAPTAWCLHQEKNVQLLQQ